MACDFTAYEPPGDGTDGGTAPRIGDEAGGDSTHDRSGGLAAANVRIAGAGDQGQRGNEPCESE